MKDVKQVKLMKTLEERFMSGPKPLVAAALLALATTTLAAADVAIKLGTQAPTNSMWPSRGVIRTSGTDLSW